MTLPLFIDAVAANARPHDRITLRGEEAQHAGTVLRLGVGDQLELSDGAGRVARCEILAVSGKARLELDVLEVREHQQRQPVLTVVQALPKSERSELAVDLLTQAGVDSIIPWQAQRSIAKWPAAKREKSRTKWVNAATAAAKQSRRPDIPKIHELATVSTVVQHIAETRQRGGRALILHETAERSLATLPTDELAVTEVLLVIGPEGGITEQELAEFRAAGATPILLGPEVLRTATAGMVALAVISSQTGRWAGNEVSVETQQSASELSFDQDRLPESENPSNRG